MEGYHRWFSQVVARDLEWRDKFSRCIASLREAENDPRIFPLGVCHQILRCRAFKLYLHLDTENGVMSWID